MVAQGLDPVAEFVPPEESRHSAGSESVPPRVAGPQGGQFPELNVFQSSHRAEHGRTRPAGDHPRDAATRGIRDGDAVRVFNGAAKSAEGSSGRQSAAGSGRRGPQLGQTYSRESATLTCLLPKNLPTWATPPRFIPSWLRWSFCEADPVDPNRSIVMSRLGLDALHGSTV